MSKVQYRPEIDGLRAIAVVSVMLYHVGVGCAGGFVGVDVVFAISGFLITSLILQDVSQKEFSIAAFWERRVRRIAPMLVVVLAATFVAGWFTLLPADFKDFGRSLFAQA